MGRGIVESSHIFVEKNKRIMLKDDPGSGNEKIHLAETRIWYNNEQEMGTHIQGLEGMFFYPLGGRG